MSCILRYRRRHRFWKAVWIFTISGFVVAPEVVRGLLQRISE